MSQALHPGYVVAGLGPAIHVLAAVKTWMRGTSPRMTVITAIQHNELYPCGPARRGGECNPSGSPHRRARSGRPISGMRLHRRAAYRATQTNALLGAFGHSTIEVLVGVRR